MKNIILCGGNGTRLWPLSRKLMPKQFLKLFDNNQKSLFQKTVERNIAICDEFMIITNEEQYFLASDQLEEMVSAYSSQLTTSELQFLLEEMGKNTAPAIAFAALKSDEEDILFVTPSDHLIKDEERYTKTINIAKELAQKGHLVTFGIEPSEPHTGYGYIGYVVSSEQLSGYDVKTFHEKPDINTAKKYIQKNTTHPLPTTNYLWNSGMFMFKAGVFLKELQKHSPEVYEACKKVYENHIKDFTIHNPRFTIAQSRITNMQDIPDISIDYAVMEKSDKIKAVKGEFDWNDVGSFDSLIGELSDESLALSVEEDSKNNFYYSDNQKKVIATIGLEDFIVIDTNDALLVAKKGETQKIKDIINQLELNTLHSTLNTHSVVHRPWGTYENLVQGNGYKIKRIVVKPGKRLSLQKHFHRNEHWIVVSGTAKVQVGDKTYLVRPNESTYIKMGEVHRLSNPGKMPIILIEAQVGEYTGEDDIVRLEDDYERK